MWLAPDLRQILSVDGAKRQEKLDKCTYETYPFALSKTELRR